MTTLPYASFWMAGFEGADHVNAHGTPLDLVQANGHLEHFDEDYRRIAALGMRTVRESVGWRIAEPGAESTGHRFDFSRALRMAEAAERHELQVLWTLMHYGRPADVDIFDDSFAPRLATFSAAAARALRGSTLPPVFTPVNEISFLAWAIAHTDLIHPYQHEAARRPRNDGSRLDVGWDAKVRLVRGVLAAIDAIRAEDRRARILHVEPLVHIVPPRREPHLAEQAGDIAEYQWQAWQMLSGTLLPELGGSAEALDLLGVNYYHNCQWEMNGGSLEWHLDDPRRITLASLLRKAWKRFGRPLLISETSHIGSGRARWMEHIGRELAFARQAGVPVIGACLYPVIDRPDWNDAAHWHHSGLWDIEPGAEGAAPRRKMHFGYAKKFLRARHLVSQTPVTETPMQHLIVFSHLRWNFVFQRPQHLLSRLARHYHVVFVEEPLHTDGPAFLERSMPSPNVEVLRAHTPVDAGGFHDDQLSALQPMVARYLADNAIDDYVVWFYTPMALPMLGVLEPRAVVYDCMDELSAFKNAPRQMRQRENALLKSADLVVTGGPRLYEAKRGLNANVLCLPSAVDAVHYSADRALADEGSMRAADEVQGSIGGPRLGFFGVIDERLDIELIAQVADADPEWHVVMAGPVVKIDPAALPRRPNLHWLGQQPYSLLPQLVAKWDVCLMPFALNESTEFISPTKTLEYMAAGKPVVSTRIHDVVAMFSEVVTIVDGPAAFIDACRVAVAESPEHAAERQDRMRQTVSRYSWDEAAATVHAAIEALPSNRVPASRAELAADAPALKVASAG